MDVFMTYIHHKWCCKRNNGMTEIESYRGKWNDRETILLSSWIEQSCQSTENWLANILIINSSFQSLMEHFLGIWYEIGNTGGGIILQLFWQILQTQCGSWSPPPKKCFNHDVVTFVVFSTTLQYNVVLSDIDLCHEIAPHATFYIALNVVANWIIFW